MINKLLIKSDGNELEYSRTIKGKEILHEYIFTKSETKKGKKMTMTENQINEAVRKEIFVIQN